MITYITSDIAVVGIVSNAVAIATVMVAIISAPPWSGLRFGEFLEVLLSMGSNLNDSPRLNHIANKFPLFIVFLDTDKENLVFFFRPAAFYRGLS